MRIAIVGAGIVGVATAYELARDGHQVTVWEQRSAVAEEASFGTAGWLSPSLLIPWAAPGLWQSEALWAHSGTAAIGLTRGAGVAGWLWRWRWARAARQPQALQRLRALHALGQYSQERTRGLLGQMQATDLPSEVSHGSLVLLRRPQDMQLLQPAWEVLRSSGQEIHEVDAETARLIEPGLSQDTPLAGAVHLPQGLAMNCRWFAWQLLQAAQAMGVQFNFDSTVTAVSSHPCGVQIAGRPGLQQADAVVLCAPALEAAWVQSLKLKVPLMALHGYTISAPLREDIHAPQGLVLDPLHRISMTRQGLRVRVSGVAEIGTPSAATQQKTVQTLFLALSGWFPGGAHTHSPQVQVWRGTRAMLPDGAPLLGASSQPGVWLNMGHGGSGWAQACGSARLLADQIAGRTPALDMQAWLPQRF